MKRPSRPFSYAFLIIAFVFAQLTGVAHACQVGFKANMAEPAPASAFEAGCCDTEQPAHDLACDNHCQLGDKAPDRAQLASAASFAAAVFAIAPVIVPQPQLPPAAFPAPDLARHTQPSISIRNCCFRI